MQPKRKVGYYYELDEIIEKFERREDISHPSEAILGLAYELRDLIEAFSDYVDQERGYDP